MYTSDPPHATAPRWAAAGVGLPGGHEAEALAGLIGLCVSAEYRLAATDAWGAAALAILKDTCVRIGAAVQAQGIDLPVAPPAALGWASGTAAQCVALNGFLQQIRRHCQARLHRPGTADTGLPGNRAPGSESRQSADHRWFRPKAAPRRMPHPLDTDDLAQLRLAFRRIQRLLAHSGPCPESAALMRQVDAVLARIDSGDLDCDPLWSVLGQAQRTLAALGPRARTLAQAFAQVTHIVGSAHLRHNHRAVT